MNILEPRSLIFEVTGVDFYPVDERLIPNFYDLQSDNTYSLLFTRVIRDFEGSIFSLMELRKFNSSNKFNLTLSVKNLQLEKSLSSLLSISNKVTGIYGIDDSSFGQVDNEEVSDIKKNKWLGRAWLEDQKFKIPILLSQDEGNYFSITFFLDSNDFEIKTN